MAGPQLVGSRRVRTHRVPVRTVGATLICVLTAAAAGCGSSTPKPAQTVSKPHVSALSRVRSCLNRLGYAIGPDTAAALQTAPRRFEFVAVWNLARLKRIQVAITFSRSVEGARLAATWTRKENKKLGKGVVEAPVVRIGKIDVLWTAKPGARQVREIYGCVRT